jgi:hypothetical protein
MTALAPNAPLTRQQRRAGTAKGRARASADPKAFAFTIRDAQAMGAPGRTSIYALAKEGRLKLLKVGRRTLVDGASLRSLLGA